MAAHHEIHFEAYVTAKLAQQGWLEGKPEAYDKQRALYPEDVIAWVKSTQPEVWAKLEKLNGPGADEALLDRLDKALAAKTGGTLNVLRKGFAIAGAGTIKMGQRAPEDQRNQTVNDHYAKNRLRVVRQLKYCPTREWSIDLGFFINGIPVATVELKTDFTQSLDHAKNQYKHDRLPIDPKTKRKEPLLTFRRGAVVHFAMSDTEIAMTTKLAGESTFFLPFNKGNKGHAGNEPRDDGEYPVAYFWEDICKPDNWLRIFHSFAYVEVSEMPDSTGKIYKKETLIFPRYHQYRAVNQMVADVEKHGVGMQYLFEHSAGSGKTSTIAWTSHDLIRMRTPEGKAIFNSVIIVTDRTVLDAQLQDAVQQLDHQHGVIEAIDRQNSSLSKSKQLAQALLKGAPIIVVTIQTFPFAMEAILTEKSLSDRNFAVIIDEAHTSQTGSTAQGLRAALGMKSQTDMSQMTIEEVLLEVQKARVQPKNVSHFAFTATPKHSTYTLFGRPERPDEPVTAENPPRAFDLYTQRQAIEEGFILDVLENYLTYETAYKLGAAPVEDKRVDKKYARRALAKWKSLHPTNVTQKVAFIIDHFQKNIAHLLDGEAKAMVVTSGRAQAVKYKLAFDKYMEKNKIGGIKALVAFSGKVPGADLGEEDPSAPLGIDIEKDYTEYNLNPEINGQDLRHAFERSDYRVMLVANKFQTGFNQPKLVAMYLDKKISGVEAVQTLSRLNRTYGGKDAAYVIDFANESEVILEAFRLYDEGAQISDVQDVNVVYDMKDLLDDVCIYNSNDVEQFKQARGKTFVGKTAEAALHKKLFAATQRPTDVFNSKLKALNEAIEHWDKAIDKAHQAGDEKAETFADSQRSEYTKEREGLMLFKTQLSRFVRTYYYIAQLIDLADPELENFAAFTHLVSKRLKGMTPEQIDLSALVLTGYVIRPVDDEQPEGDEKGTLKPIDPSDREKEYLSKIIERLNELFGDSVADIDKQHFAAHTLGIVEGNTNVVDQVDKNTKQQALHGDLPEAVKQAVVRAMTSDDALARTLLTDPQVMASYVGVIYDLMKNRSARDMLAEGVGEAAS